MISKHDIRFIRSLHEKEGRLESGMFAAGGTKITLDLIRNGHKPEMLAATEEWAGKHAASIAQSGNTLKIASRNDIARCSTLKTPQDVISVWRIPVQPDLQEIGHGLVLALDEVQDPGNVGTIIRIAAWFGIRCILCSPACADVYNPKVIQASMGSFFRVSVIYGDLGESIRTLKGKGFRVAAAVMEGAPLDTFQPEGAQIIIMGNESKGVSELLLGMAETSVTIPSFTPGGSGVESLNVATAAAVICYETCKKIKHES